MLKKIPKLKQLSAIEIRFYDPASDYGWKVAGDIVAAPILCTAVGYYVSHNLGYITLCMIKHASESSIADCLSVPLGCVSSVRSLK